VSRSFMFPGGSPVSSGQPPSFRHGLVGLHHAMRLAEWRGCAATISIKVN
jgi:hypothetical protein